MQLTEAEIIANAYYILEQDNEAWEDGDSEYSTARGLLNVGVKRWERYENTVWRELWATLTQSTQVSPTLVKTLTAGTYTYTCPTDFRRPSSYVRTVSGSGSTYWRVIPPEDIAAYANSDDYVCWFTGNIKDGFVLNFNPRVSLTTGDTINYEYYKQATQTADPDDSVEMDDPNYLCYFIAAHMADGGIDPTFFQISEELLENMRTANMSGLHLVPDDIQSSPETNDGFGR